MTPFDIRLTRDICHSRTQVPSPEPWTTYRVSAAVTAANPLPQVRRARRPPFRQHSSLCLEARRRWPCRQLPAWPDEMAGVAAGISLEIILMLRLGLPEIACRHHFRRHLAGPQA